MKIFKFLGGITRIFLRILPFLALLALIGYIGFYAVREWVKYPAASDPSVTESRISRTTVDTLSFQKDFTDDIAALKEVVVAQQEEIERIKEELKEIKKVPPVVQPPKGAVQRKAPPCYCPPRIVVTKTRTQKEWDEFWTPRY